MSNHSTRLHHALPTAGRGHNRYCGPAALAAITGLSTGEAAKLLREISGKAYIKGTAVSTMLAALNQCGFPVTHKATGSAKMAPTMKRWLEDCYDGSLVLVEAWNHWWAMADGYFVDSFCNLLTPVSDIHHPRCKIRKVFYLD